MSYVCVCACGGRIIRWEEEEEDKIRVGRKERTTVLANTSCARHKQIQGAST